MNLIIFKNGYEFSDFLPDSGDLLEYIYDRYIRCWEIRNHMDRSLIRYIRLYWEAYVRGSSSMACDVMGLFENHIFLDVKSWLLYKSRDNKIDLLCS